MPVYLITYAAAMTLGTMTHGLFGAIVGFIVAALFVGMYETVRINALKK